MSDETKIIQKAALGSDTTQIGEQNNYKKALELYPTHPEAQKRLKKLNKKNDSKE